VNKKIPYLFIALLLPGLIFLFLKFFGKNEFDIAVYYQKGISSDTLSGKCNIHVQGQYHVPDSVFEKWGKLESILLVSYSNEKETEWISELSKNGKLVYHRQVCGDCSRDNLKDCVLFLKEPYNSVLIDSQKRIRGYYKLGDIDEMDRLQVEIKILLKMY
jgi:hypothetical protein